MTRVAARGLVGGGSPRSAGRSPTGMPTASCPIRWAPRSACSRPRAIGGQPSTWGGVGSPNARSNHSRTGAEKWVRAAGIPVQASEWIAALQHLPTDRPTGPVPVRSHVLEKRRAVTHDRHPPASSTCTAALRSAPMTRPVPRTWSRSRRRRSSTRWRRRLPAPDGDRDRTRPPRRRPTRESGRSPLLRLESPASTVAELRARHHSACVAPRARRRRLHDPRTRRRALARWRRRRGYRLQLVAGPEQPRRPCEHRACEHPRDRQGHQR